MESYRRMLVALLRRLMGALPLGHPADLARLAPQM